MSAPGATAVTAAAAPGAAETERQARLDRWLLMSAWAVTAAMVVAAGAGLWMNAELARRSASSAASAWDLWSGLAGTVVLVGCAMILIVRRRRHLIGWLFLALAALDMLEGIADWIALLQIHGTSHAAGSAGVWAALAESLQRPEFLIVFAVVLLFPTGRVPSPRWRPVGWCLAALAGAWFLVHLLSPEALEEDPFAGLRNPLGRSWLGGPVLHYAFLPAAGVLGVLVIASLLVRFRRSRAEERQQLKWVGFAAAGVPFAVIGLGVTSIFGTSAMNVAGDAVSIFSGILLPVAVVVAITRYRLYDLDLLVNGTVLYTVLCAALLGTYAFVVLLATRLVVGVGWTAPGVVAAPTLTVAIIAAPARRGIQQGLDRVFRRRAWAANRQIQAFAAHCRDSPQPPQALQQVLACALGDPSAELGLWLRERGEFVGVDGIRQPPPDHAAGRSALEIRAHADPVGRIVHTTALDRDHRLLATVAAAASLVTENARLQAEILVQLAEVQSSRARIVAAADAERRRVERDLHDGAQQRLVGLALRVKLASRSIPADPGPLLADIVTELHHATRELRELARGIHPAALDEGLHAALESLVSRLPVHVDIDIPEQRLSSDVELNAYYLAGEAITNTVKHSGATQVTVQATLSDQHLHLMISDNGCGGADPARGSGLAGLSDRVAAAAGTIAVDSPPGLGTTITASLPCVY